MRHTVLKIHALYRIVSSFWNFKIFIWPYICQNISPDVYIVTLWLRYNVVRTTIPINFLFDRYGRGEDYWYSRTIALVLGKWKTVHRNVTNRNRNFARCNSYRFSDFVKWKTVSTLLRDWMIEYFFVPGSCMFIYFVKWHSTNCDNDASAFLTVRRYY